REHLFYEDWGHEARSGSQGLRLSWLKPRRFLGACRLFLVPAREARRLLDVDKTCEQTRSGTRHTPALGQDLPRIRALDGLLACCTQARLRTFPGYRVPGTRGNGICWIKVGRQEGRVQVTLHRANATGALVPAERERLLDGGATAMTILRQ